MKNFYLVLMCGFLCCGQINAAPRFAAKKPGKTTHIVKKSPANAMWRPATQTEYLYMDGEWLDLGTTTFTYDTKGNAISELTEGEDGIIKTDKEYDEYGQVTSSISMFSEDGSSWTGDSKTTYIYDPILHSYFIERMGYDWEGEWVPNYRCETNSITRDSKGNIVEIMKSLPLGIDMLPAYKLLWNYDETSGKANGMTYYCNYSADAVENWEIYDDTEYRNITWEASDGQMTDADISTYLEGNNMISSCEVYYGGELDGHFIVTYDGKGGYTALQTYPDPQKVGISTTKEMLDEYSYVICTKEYFDEDGNYSPKPTYISYLTTMINEYGDITLEEYSEDFDGEPDILEGYAYDYSYDENGNMTECETKYYDYEMMEYVPEYKITYEGYTQISGVDDIAASHNGKTEYFDMQGRRVTNPASGIYLMRRDGKVSKVFVR